MAENPFLKLLNSPPPDPGVEDNPFLSLLNDPGVPEPDNPFLTLLDKGDPSEKPVAVSDPLIAIQQEIDTAIEANERNLSEVLSGVPRGFQLGNSGFYNKLANGAAFLKRQVEFDEGAQQNVPSALQLINRAADFVVQKIGGSRDGALDLMENSFRRLSTQTAPDPGTGSTLEQIGEAVGSTPMVGAEFSLAMATLGPAGVGIVEALNEADKGDFETALGFTRGALLGGIFKGMEGLVPKVPKSGRARPRATAAKDPSDELALSQERTPARIDIERGPQTKPKPFQNAIEKVYTEVFREFAPLEKAAKIVGDTDLKNQVRLSVGNAGNVVHFLEFGGYNALTKRITGNRGLLEVMENIPRNKWSAFEEYLVAKRQLADLEPRKIKSPYSKDSLKKKVAEGESEGSTVARAEEVYRYNQDLLNYVVDSELATEGAAANYLAANPHYVPFQRAGKAELSTRTVPGRQGEIIKAIEGSERIVVSPLTSMVRQTARLIDASDKNRLMLALSRNAGKSGAERFIVKGKPKPAPKTASSQGQLDLLESIENAGPKALTEAEAKAAGVPDNFVSMNVHEKGVPTEYFVDPDIANALGAFNFSNPNRFVDNFLIKALSIPAQILRAGTVDMPSFFLVKNPVRDALTTVFQSRNGAKPGLSLFDGLFSYIKRDEAFKLWIRSGGANSTLVAMDRPVMRKALRDMMNERQHSAWREIGETMMSPIRVMQSMAQAVEAATRIGDLKAGLRRAGGAENVTPEQLRQISVSPRDVTVDFGIRGSSNIMQAFSKITAFANAKLQGMDIFLRMHKENPGKALALGGLMTTGTLALQHYQTTDEETGEEFRERYRRLPNWRKMFFWNIHPKHMGLENVGVLKDRLVPVPIPFEWGLIYKTVPEAIANAYMLDDPNYLKDVAETVASESQPFVSIDRGKVRFNLPTAVQPFVDIQQNRRSFFDTPIHTQGELKLPPEMRFDQNTTNAALLMSDFMHGYYSPKEIDVLVQGFAGKMGTTLAKSLDKPLQGVAQKGFGDIPQLKPFADNQVGEFLFGGMLNRTTEEGSSQIISDFWNAYNDTIPAVNGLNELIKQGAAKNAQTFFQENQDKIILGRKLEAAAKRIMNVNKTKRAVIRNPAMSRLDKEKIIRRLNLSIDRFAGIALGLQKRNR